MNRLNLILATVLALSLVSFCVFTYFQSNQKAEYIIQFPFRVEVPVVDGNAFINKETLNRIVAAEGLFALTGVNLSTEKETVVMLWYEISDSSHGYSHKQEIKLGSPKSECENIKDFYYRTNLQSLMADDILFSDINSENIL